MKTIKLFALSIFIWSASSAQNLVSNPSFENITNCPTSISLLTNATGWINWNITPDLFHVCASANIGVPNNGFGFQYPRSGDAYAGFHSYSDMGSREALATQLIQPLTIGQKYFVKFFVNRAHSLIGNAYQGRIAGSNKLGALFTTFNYTTITNPSPVNNFAQVYSDSLIADSANWVLISGSFVADSAYTYVGFGNFFDNANTTVVAYGIDTPYFAYYYIDDISVSIDSLFVTGVSSINSDIGASIYPNPFNDMLYISIPDPTTSEIILYDLLGRIQLRKEFAEFIKLNTEELMEGIYLFEIRNRNGVVDKGKVLKR